MPMHLRPLRRETPVVQAVRVNGAARARPCPGPAPAAPPWPRRAWPPSWS